MAVRELARGTEGRGVGYMLSLLILDKSKFDLFLDWRSNYYMGVWPMLERVDLDQ
jgi:endo-1,4-beta-D-glucanase Y